MTVQERIDAYIASQPEQKRKDLEALHLLMLRISPQSRLWFLDGRDETGKIVSNPNIGYGRQIIDHANGKSREFYQIGLSANTAGISLYLIGIEDRKYLGRTYGARLGKASITGYCIKFKALEYLDPTTLEEIIRFGFEPRA